MKLRSFLMIITLLLLVALAAIVWYYPANEDFRTDNPFWNGMEKLSEQYPVSVLMSLDSLPSEPGGTTTVLIPYLEYTESELRQIEGYVSHGGTLIIMDDYGNGNEILQHLGISPRFSQGALLDPLFNYKSKWLPEVSNFREASFGENVKTIVLNHATSLNNIPETQAMAWSSDFSYLDMDFSSTWSEDEPKGPFPIAAVVPLESGLVVLIADPSIMINSMVGMEDNSRFIEEIITFQDQQPEVMLDQSHLPEGSLEEAKGWLATARGRLASTLGLSVLMIAVLVVALRPLWRRR